MTSDAPILIHFFDAVKGKFRFIWHRLQVSRGIIFEGVERIF
jgi:hypothetical protein